MRPLKLSAAALLALGTLGSLGTTAASAATTTPVMFTGVTATPTTISYGNNTVTVTGQLDQAIEHTGGPVAGAPVPDAPVSLENVNTATVLSTVTTDANGNFTATATLPAAATLRTVTASGAPYADAQVGQVKIYAKQQTPVVTLNPQPASTVRAGTNLTFTGTATVNINGTVTPLPGATVALLLNGRTTSASEATTAADGTFSLTATNPLAGGQWTAEVEPPSGHTTPDPDLYGFGTSNADTVNIQHSTRIVNFSAPATAEAHGYEKITGTAQIADGSAWLPSDQPTVTIYSRYSTTGSWSQASSVNLNSNGTFTAYLALKPGTAQVQARVAQENGGTEYLASSTPVKTITVHDQTCFTGTSVGHFDGRTTVDGMVIDWCGSKNQTFKTVTGYAQVYYRKGTSGSWTHLGSAKLGQGGTFAYTKYSTLHGYFYVTYPAQGYFLASASAIHHIS